MADARVDQHGYVYGHLPATPGLEAAPALGFIAHLDTAAFRGENVNPQVIENYDGGDVALGDSGKLLRPADFPHLTGLKGRTLVTTDGTTLLGADDKAGIAEIMTLAAELAEGPPHGTLCVAFTPDEEIGAVRTGLTGPPLARISPTPWTVAGKGKSSTRTSTPARRRSWSTALTSTPAREKIPWSTQRWWPWSATPCSRAGETPRDTEDYEGFYHLDQISGNVERAELHYLLRDHSAGGFQARKDTLTHVVKLLNEKYGPGTVELTLRDQYANMAEVIQQNFHLIERAKSAAEQAGIAPLCSPSEAAPTGRG